MLCGDFRRGSVCEKQMRTYFSFQMPEKAIRLEMGYRQNYF